MTTTNINRPTNRPTNRSKKTRRKSSTYRKKHTPSQDKTLPGPKTCHPRIGSSKPLSGCFSKTVRKRFNYNKNCNKEDDRCLLETSSFSEQEKHTLAKNFLRPKRPISWESNPDEWLDSNNIQDVMKQYEETYKNFRFLGVLPIDFSVQDPYSKTVGKCLIDKICTLNLAKLRSEGVSSIGVIFNLDPHFKNGSHWVGTYIDLKKRKVLYFDSYGIQPPDHVAKLMKSLKLQDPQLSLEYNARRFQYKDSECGMYSLYFIISMLQGKDFKQFCKVSIPDSVMLKFRHWIFS